MLSCFELNYFLTNFSVFILPELVYKYYRWWPCDAIANTCNERSVWYRHHVTSSSAAHWWAHGVTTVELTNAVMSVFLYHSQTTTTFSLSLHITVTLSLYIYMCMYSITQSLSLFLPLSVLSLISSPGPFCSRVTQSSCLVIAVVLCPLYLGHILYRAYLKLVYCTCTKDLNLKA